MNSAITLTPSEAALWDKHYVVKKDSDRNILCDPYVVQKGDWIYKIFRQKGEISQKDYPAFLDILKNINPQIGDIDQIYPGNLVLIPLRILTQDTLPLYTSESAVIPFASISDTPIKTVEIRKGDTIAKLILGSLDRPDSREYQKALRQFKRLNPEITDPNQITIGQKIRLPALWGFNNDIGEPDGSQSPQTGPLVTLFPEDASALTVNELPHSSDTTDDEYNDPTANPPSVPKITNILEQIASLLDAELYDQGSYHFPIKGEKDLRLDLGLFPVIRLKDNTRIIFLRPFSKALSEVSTIRSQWKPVFFVRIPATPVSIYYLLDKVFGSINLNRQQKKIRFKDGGVTTDIHAKWIMKMEDAPGQPIRHICLTPVDQKTGPFPESIFRYLASRRITFWGVKPDGHISGTTSPSDAHTGIVKQPIPIKNPKSFIRRIAPALGWSYKENVEVRFPYGGYQVEAVSNMLQINTERSCLVDFGNFAGDSISAIEATGLKVVSLKRPYDPLKYTRQILTKLSFSYTQNPTIYVQNLKDKQGVSFTYPGLMVPQQDGQTLMTPASLPEEMVFFLESRGTQIVKVLPQ